MMHMASPEHPGASVVEASNPVLVDPVAMNPVVDPDEEDSSPKPVLEDV